MRLEVTPDIRFAELYRGYNERIPVDGFYYGQARVTSQKESGGGPSL